MRKKRKHTRPEPVYVKRILGEASACKKQGVGQYHCSLNLSELLGSLPMTINQDDIKIEASFEKGSLNLIVYCDEWISSPENFSGGIYVVDEKEES